MDSRRALSIVLSIVGIACRVLAIAMCAVTAILCFSGIAAQLGIVGLVVAVFLFAIDYGCSRASRALR